MNVFTLLSPLAIFWHPTFLKACLPGLELGVALPRTMRTLFRGVSCTSWTRKPILAPQLISPECQHDKSAACTLAVLRYL